mmetsp:Transcript_1716/g.3832  ORF Transcript_1716/g.3832 Transcript_1716/m.3832 type:complete len:246 (-) Transcript_1716:116-853(-)
MGAGLRVSNPPSSEMRLLPLDACNDCTRCCRLSAISCTPSADTGHPLPAQLMSTYLLTVRSSNTVPRGRSEDASRRAAAAGWRTHTSSSDSGIPLPGTHACTASFRAVRLVSWVMALRPCMPTSLSSRQYMLNSFRLTRVESAANATLLSELSSGSQLKSSSHLSAVRAVRVLRAFTSAVATNETRKLLRLVSCASASATLGPSTSQSEISSSWRSGRLLRSDKKLASPPCTSPFISVNTSFLKR